MHSTAQKIFRGTLLLTAAGLITRILGFFYKIYLADLLGANLLGKYQLIFPVYAICFTIYGAGIQTAISQVIASGMGRRSNFSPLRIFAPGTAIALALACFLQVFVYTQADLIALRFVMEPSIAPYLRILSVFFPFCCLSACINGYYYGMQNAKVPAVGQIIEQLFRIGFVLAATILWLPNASPEEYCQLAVWGLAVGEISACIYNVIRLMQWIRKSRPSAAHSRRQYANDAKTLLWLSSTLTITRLFITFLNSIESILLPAMLRRYGCSVQDALSIYGVLNGMTFSFLLFPSTITNSLAVMLVPSIAEANARQDKRLIRKSILSSIHGCLLLGVLCTGLFLLFGHDLGRLCFHNEDAGNYLTALAWLCPFLYLSTTLISIINGLKKTQVSFLITAVSLGVKILFLLFAVPHYGIRLYLIGLLVSQLIQVLLALCYLFPYLSPAASQADTLPAFDAVHFLLLPCLLLLPCALAAKSSCHIYDSCFPSAPGMPRLALSGAIFCIIYAAGMLLILPKRDLRILHIRSRINPQSTE